MTNDEFIEVVEKELKQCPLENEPVIMQVLAITYQTRAIESLPDKIVAAIKKLDAEEEI